MDSCFRRNDKKGDAGEGGTKAQRRDGWGRTVNGGRATFLPMDVGTQPQPITISR